VKYRKVIRKPIDIDEDGVRVAGGVNAVVSANVNEKEGSRSTVSSRQRVRVVQRDGKTEVYEEESTTEDGKTTSTKREGRKE
jgi:hypothetical protein